MRLQTIEMEVRGMTLEPQTDYMAEPTRKFNETRVQLQQVDDRPSPFSSAHVLINLREGAPNPFVLGQRLTLAIDPDARPEQVPPPIPGSGPRPQPDGHPFTGVADVTDQALGLGDKARDYDESDYGRTTTLSLVGARG